MKVFINKRQLSEESAAALLKLFPSGGIYSEELVYKKIRQINLDMLPKDCQKSPTDIRNEIDKLISEELTCRIDVEGLTCEKVEKMPTFEDEHEKTMKALKELAAKEEREAKEKEEKKEEPEPKEEKKKEPEAPQKTRAKRQGKRASKKAKK